MRAQDIYDLILKAREGRTLQFKLSGLWHNSEYDLEDMSFSQFINMVGCETEYRLKPAPEVVDWEFSDFVKHRDEWYVDKETGGMFKITGLSVVEGEVMVNKLWWNVNAAAANFTLDDGTKLEKLWEDA